MRCSSTFLAVTAAMFIGLPVLGAGAPTFAMAASAGAQPGATTPMRARHRHHHGWLHALRTLNLSQAQRGQIGRIIADFRSAHPKGIRPDPAARKALREKILAVLTPQQRQQLTAILARRHRHAFKSPSAPGT
jgi:Spy/CpxP family protein refolding chaperone